jgi:hypothetical protein
MCTKLVELFANWVVERRNMINDYLRGRGCIESVRGEYRFGAFALVRAFLSSSLPFCLALLLFMSFAGFCGFPSSI